MREYFEGLSAELDGLLAGNEVYLATFAAEDSDFIRLNQSAVRQAGCVAQRRLGLQLVDGARHAHLSVALGGALDDDKPVLRAAVDRLRQWLGSVDEDPHFLFNETVAHSERTAVVTLPQTAQMLDVILGLANGVDLVGFLASGHMYRGFANSLGQRNWHVSASVNFDWSLYLGGDRAVKAAYAGQHWDTAEVERAMARARHELTLLKRPAMALQPGAYRTYLAPSAVVEVMELLAWGGFGLKQHRTRRSPLMRLGDAREQLHESVFVSEASATGLAPTFQDAGFLKPDAVPLINAGHLAEPLVSPRSAREYGLTTNGANDAEAPESLSMRGGDLDPARVLESLDTGLYVNNLWYLNYSDRPACRMTGMTRFAAFWVEGGEIVAPVSVMRFDDSVYRLLGQNLKGLTSEPELIQSTDTYEARSAHSMRLPGALVEDFRLTL